MEARARRRARELAIPHGVELERQREEVAVLTQELARLSRDVRLLSQGWQQRTASGSGEAYWYNTITQDSSWTKPRPPRELSTPTPRGRSVSFGADRVREVDARQAQPQAGKGKGRDKAQGKAAPQPAGHGGQQQQEEEEEEEDEDEDEEEEDEENEEDVELPEGWEAAKSSSSGEVYYHHAATGRTQWDRPTSAAERRYTPRHSPQHSRPLAQNLLRCVY